MNKTTAIFLVNKSVRCISVAYALEEDIYTKKAKPKDVKSFKTLDADIAEGDLVVVPTDTRLGFTTGKVVKTDLHVDFDSSEQMRWIVARVPLDSYTSIVEQEAKAMDAVAEADHEARRQELADKMLRHRPKLDGLTLFAPTHSAPKASGFEDDTTAGRGGSQS